MKDTSITVDTDTGRAEINILNFFGNKTYNMYMGQFEVKCILPAGDYIKANKEFMALVGNSPDNEAAQIAYALVQMKYRFTKMAPWWISPEDIMNGSHITDYNLITHLYNACMEAEEEYKNMMKKNFENNKDRAAAVRKSMKAKLEAEEEEEVEETEEIEF